MADTMKERAAQIADKFASGRLKLEMTRPNGAPAKRVTVGECQREIEWVASIIAQEIRALPDHTPDGGA